MFYLHVERPRNCLPEHVSTLSSKWFPGSTTWPWRHTKLYVNLVYSHLDCTWLLQRCVCGCYRLDSRQRHISLSIYIVLTLPQDMWQISSRLPIIVTLYYKHCNVFYFARHAGFRHSVTQRNVTHRESFTQPKSVAYYLTQPHQTPQRRLRLFGALRKQMETTSIFSATPDGGRRTRPISAAITFNLWLRPCDLGWKTELT